MLSTEKIKLAIPGLGYVGLPLAVEFRKNRSVTAFVINTDCSAELQLGKDLTLEVPPEDLQEAQFLTFTADLEGLRLQYIYCDNR